MRTMFFYNKSDKYVGSVVIHHMDELIISFLCFLVLIGLLFIISTITIVKQYRTLSYIKKIADHQSRINNVMTTLSVRNVMTTMNVENERDRWDHKRRDRRTPLEQKQEDEFQLKSTIYRL